MKQRRGFTLIEMLMVVTIIAIIAAIALPKYRTMRRHAMATQLIGDFDVLRHATLSFYVDSGYFPRAAGDASVPPALRPYLPTGFAMTKPQWSMEYVQWDVPPPVPAAKTAQTVGVTFTTSDPDLGMTAVRLSGGRPGVLLGTTYTFLVTF